MPQIITPKCFDCLYYIGVDAVFKKEDGEIIMGGLNGLLAFYPDQITVSKLKSKATITGFYLNNNKVKIKL